MKYIKSFNRLNENKYKLVTDDVNDIITAMKLNPDIFPRLKETIFTTENLFNLYKKDKDTFIKLLNNISSKLENADLTEIYYRAIKDNEKELLDFYRKYFKDDIRYSGFIINNVLYNYMTDCIKNDKNVDSLIEVFKEMQINKYINYRYAVDAMELAIKYKKPKIIRHLLNRWKTDILRYELNAFAIIKIKHLLGKLPKEFEERLKTKIDTLTLSELKKFKQKFSDDKEIQTLLKSLSPKIRFNLAIIENDNETINKLKDKVLFGMPYNKFIRGVSSSGIEYVRGYMQYRIFDFLNKQKKVRRKDLINFIVKLKYGNSKTFKSYYSDAFAKWAKNNLLNINQSGISLTAHGRTLLRELKQKFED